MIRIIKRRDLDLQKYDSCIDESLQSRIFAFSWYLDVTVEHWQVAVLNDYEAVMPLPVRQKFGISYVYPPFWILELGIFSKGPMDDSVFIEKIKDEFRWIELRLNSSNTFDFNLDVGLKMQYQQLSLSETFDQIQNSYRKDRKKDLRKAKESGLVVKWDDDSNHLIDLFKKSIGKRTSNITESDYKNLREIIRTCSKKGLGRILSVYAEDDSLVASSFVLLYKNTCTILVSATDFSNRNNGANTFLIDTLLRHYQDHFEFFNFGGSSIQSVGEYFKSFGANTVDYPFIAWKKHPKLFKLLGK